MSSSAATKFEDDSVVSVLCGDIYGCVGYRDGKRTDAMFNVPCDILPFPDGSMLVCDCLNYCIRRVDPEGLVETFAGSLEDTTRLGSPACIVPFEGGFLIGDMEAGTLRKIENDGSCSIFEELSASKVPGGRRVRCPSSLLVLDIGILITDNHGHRILLRKPSGEIINWAGNGVPGNQNGPLQGSSFHRPQCLLQLESGAILVSDHDNHELRIIDNTYKTVMKYAGTGVEGHRDGYRLSASFTGPDKTILLPDGNIALTDMVGHKIRLIQRNGFVSTLAGLGSGQGILHGAPLSTLWNHPCGIMYNEHRQRLCIADSENHCIRQFKYQSQKVFHRLPFGVQTFTLISLLNQPKYSDLSLELFGRTWYFHKVILRIRCPQLWPTKGFDSKRLTDDLLPSFDTLIHWIYTDSIQMPDLNTLCNLLRVIDALEIQIAHDGAKDLIALININLEAICRSTAAENDEKARKDFIQTIADHLKLATPSSLRYDILLRLIRLDLYLSLWDAPSPTYRESLEEILVSAIGSQVTHLIMESEEPITSNRGVHWEYDSYDDVQSLGQRLEDIAFQTTATEPEYRISDLDFRILVPDYVHLVCKSILASRWPYFERMLEFGGAEATKSELDLSEFLGHPALEFLLFFLYTGSVLTHRLTFDVCNQLLEHSFLFGFVDDQNMPVQTFEPLMTQVLICVLAQPDQSQFIPSYHRSKQIAGVEHQILALSNVANCFSSIVEQPEVLVREQLATLTDLDYKRILMLQFGRTKYI